jgi:hypothetical protein
VNGTYKCGKSSFMGEGYNTRGHYSIKDSIIYLDKSNLYDLVISDKLLMKTIPANKRGQEKNIFDLLFGSHKPDTIPKTFLYQLNNNGDTINSAIVLEVNKDMLTVRQ